MPITVISEAIGFIGIVLSLLSFQQKKRENILLFQMGASISFSAQLFLVGAVTGGCMDLISFARTLVFSFNDKKWASSKLWLAFFIAVMIFTGIFTWKDALSILPMTGAVLSTVALWMKKEKLILIISLFVGPCWLVYDILSGAYTGAINELLAMTSIIIGLVRLVKREKSLANNV